MRLRLPKCELCRHIIDDEYEYKCDAFPEGIPPEKDLWDYDNDEECANGIKFETEE